MTLSSALYFGSVMHRRFRPKAHSLRYSVFSMLIDLDEAAGLSARLRLFGYNRRAPLSLYDRDHGDGSANGLKAWVHGQVRAAGQDPAGGRTLLLCYPRLFGYVFNPLTVYYCFDRKDRLTLLLYEVCNTFGERHTYVIPAEAGADRLIRQQCRKRLYVSPFIPMACRYDFTLSVPGETLSVAIDEHDAEGRLLVAVFQGRRKPFTDRMLAASFVKFPLMTLKVTAAIHWQALKLWLKGVSPVPRAPAKNRVASSVTKPASRKAVIEP